jgi:hypothetical protein
MLLKERENTKYVVYKCLNISSLMMCFQGENDHYGKNETTKDRTT